MTWEPTAAHLRATVVGLTLLLPGMLAGRPDLVVLAAPFVVVSLWAVTGRPREVPQVATPLTALTVHEGEEFAWETRLTPVPGLVRVVATHPDERWLDVEPAGGRVVEAVAGSPTTVRVALRSTRWGRRTLATPSVAAYGAWNAWRWGPAPLPRVRLTTLPVPTPHDSAAPAPHPRGLVGIERASRPGEGSEFAKVRPFQAGDRLRRIHWPVSARTGRLHVTATYADEDSHVVLLIDGINDIGTSAGLDGGRSSMDVTVRAAAAIAEHFLRRGDRVGVRAFGTWGLSRVPSSSGRVQLRRILDSLCLVEAGTARGEDALAARLGLGAGTLAIMLSPLVDPAAGQQVALLSRAGLDVIVVDTLPEEVAPEAGHGEDQQARVRLAWRLRMVERRLDLEAIGSLGVPVVRWSGPASLDLVLRDLSRRRGAPRMARR